MPDRSLRFGTDGAVLTSSPPRASLAVGREEPEQAEQSQRRCRNLPKPPQLGVVNQLI